MRVVELEWDDENTQHISDHGVTNQEVEQVVFDQSSIQTEAHGQMRTVFIG